MTNLPFGEEKILEGDQVLSQLNAWLKENEAELPKTPRWGDARLVVKNTSNGTLYFNNPGKHSPKQEEIPATGKKTAFMVMPQGKTLSEQHTNGKKLYDTYKLGEEGSSEKFMKDLEAGALSQLAKEAYGPAPFDGQVNGLVHVSWPKADGSIEDIEPVKGANAAVGARLPANEIVFKVRIQDAGVPVLLKGTDTTAEKFYDVDGYKTILVGVSPVLDDNYQPTGAFTTKPIAPSAGKDFYGQNFDNIPVATLDQNGSLKSVNLSPAQSQKPALNLPEQKIA